MTQFKIGRPSKKDKAMLALADDRETIRANFILDKEFHKQMKQFALDTNITMTQLIKEAVSEYIRKYENK